ncbi:3',5'-cyclic-nucleotide phosphodiesterase [Ascosphaera acerosa]|nr:3',5'-cyclic-nucleotide phosphodiesterase [Ascosphaera acerosa]
MDLSKCHAVYVDNRVQVPLCATKDSTVPPSQAQGGSAELADNVTKFCDAFGKVHVHNSGREFSAKLSELEDESISSCTPIFAFIDIAPETASLDPQAGHRRPSTDPMVLLRRPRGRNPSLTLPFEDEDAYGLRLLSRSASDLQLFGGPSLIVPIAVFRQADNREENLQQAIPQCLDAGAADALVCPLDQKKLDALRVHAYRTRRAVEKEKQRFLSLSPQKLRKQSWVGMDEQQPYGYLREAMVSKLMKSICNPETVIDEAMRPRSPLPQERRRLIETEVAKWSFSAHKFSDDELLYAGCVMVRHALRLPGLDQWQIDEDQLYRFFSACRNAYNSFVLYHNFRHAIDVLQSTFYILLVSGMLPQYPDGTAQEPVNSLAAILTPFEVLTLIISAIGHDVGHPGVNNAFLINLKSPLAQLYNDKSVLEAFHCAAYSQILRRHWPAAFQSASMRKLMITSILATDMGLHGDFMNHLSALSDRVVKSTVDSWSPNELEENQRTLCGLIIKCADISNVARQWTVAEEWTDILQQEFHNQGEMEKEVGMKTALFGGPPELGNVIELAKGQIGFMEFFAYPLFQGIGSMLPGVLPCAEEITKNLAIWREVASKGSAASVPLLNRKRPSPVRVPSRTHTLVHTPHEDAIPEEEDPPRITSPVPEENQPASPTAAAASPMSGNSDEAESPTSPKVSSSYPNARELSSATSPSNNPSIASRPSETLTAPWSSSTFANTMTPISCQTESSSLSCPTTAEGDEDRKRQGDLPSSYPMPRVQRNSPPDYRFGASKSVDRLTTSNYEPKNAASTSLLPPAPIRDSSQQNSLEDLPGAAGRSPSRFTSIMTRLGTSPHRGSAKAPRFTLGGGGDSPASSVAGNLNVPPPTSSANGATPGDDVTSHSSQQSDSNKHSGGSSQAPNSPGRTLSKRISRLRLAFWRKGSTKTAGEIET